MGGATKNDFFANSIHNMLSTSTTSFTFVSTITITTAGSSSINFGKQTLYMQDGIILGCSTVTSTNVSQPA